MTALSNGVKVGLAVTGSLAATWALAPAAKAAGPSIMPSPNFDPWDSFSFGIGAVGTMFSTPTTASTLNYNFIGTSSFGHTTTLSGSGIGGTVEVGKDFHLAPRFVFGIYGDYTLGALSATATTTSKNLNTAYTDTLTSKLSLKNSASIIARAGYLVNPKTLIYGLLGFTGQQYTSTLTSNTTYGTSTYSKSGTMGGLTIGVGGEVMLTDMISLKGEYRFSHLGAISTFGGYSYGGGNTYALQSHGATDLHQFRVVLSTKWH